MSKRYDNACLMLFRGIWVQTLELMLELMQEDEEEEFQLEVKRPELGKAWSSMSLWRCTSVDPSGSGALFKRASKDTYAQAVGPGAKNGSTPLPTLHEVVVQ